jgi:hypothetical protein
MVAATFKADCKGDLLPGYSSRYPWLMAEEADQRWPPLNFGQFSFLDFQDFSIRIIIVINNYSAIAYYNYY